MPTQLEIETLAGSLNLPAYALAIEDARNRADQDRMEELEAEHHDERMKIAEDRLTRKAARDDEDDTSDLMALSRPDLNDAAAKAGVMDPESLPNKSAVVQAIEAVGKE